MILAIPLLFIAFVWAWPRLWFRLVQNRVDVQVIVERSQVECGEEIPIRVVIQNQSWLPCPFIQVYVELPPGLSADPDKREPLLRWSTYLLMRQEISASLTCYAMERGLQPFGRRDVVIQMNEGFGLRQLFLRRPMNEEVVVLPKRYSPVTVKLASDALLGSIEVQRWLHPDEAMLRGIRPYQAGDSYRHVAWLASARTGEWMTKQFSTTTDMDVVLLVNAQFFDNPWVGVDLDAFDDLCSWASAVAMAFSQRRIPIVFGSNATSPRDPKRLWYGDQAAAGIDVLLGRFFPMCNGDFMNLLTSIPGRVPANVPVILVAAHFTGEQLGLLQRYIRAGRKIGVVWAGDTAGRDALRSIGADVRTVGTNRKNGEEVLDRATS